MASRSSLATGVTAACVATLAAGAGGLRAQPAMPQPLKGVAFEQRLGAPLPLDARFRDESGREVWLGDYFGTKPVVLALVYYECPMLCTLVLNGLESALRVLEFDVGREFDVLTVSFDPRETPELAAKKKAGHIASYGRPGAEAGWHFLTGDEAEIQRLTSAVGFEFFWDAPTNQYAHASGIVVVTPDGKVSRYHYGIEYSPRDLRLALVEAASGKIGSVVDQAVLYCFRYDPDSGKYGVVVMRIVRLGALLTVALLGGWILWGRRRGRPAPRPSTRTA
jgi:protein SCO1/2